MDKSEIKIRLYEQVEVLDSGLHELDPYKQFVPLSFKSFWRLPFYQKLEYLAYNFLVERKVIRPKRVLECVEITLDTYELENVIMTQIINLRQNGYTPKVALIGHDIYQKISSTPFYMNHTNYPISFEHSFRESELRYHGVKIIVVPWMLGSVVLPYSVTQEG